MNEKQRQEWVSIVNSCLSPDLRSINVGSQIRRDVIIAVSVELVHLSQQRAMLLEMCKESLEAVHSLHEDALGHGWNGQCSYPLRDELESMLKNVITEGSE